MENIWAACAERWAQAFRKQQAVNIVNTNNGVEAQNKHFKYDYLPRSVDKSAYGITMLLVESFIPDILHNRPSHFIKHCMKSRFAAGEYRQGDVHCIDLDRGVFKIRSSRENMVIYSVQLQTPSCTCEAWRKTNFPCKHFYAVFNTFDEWDFSRLPESYRNNVFITLDPNVVDSISVDSEDKPQRQVKFDNRASTGNEDNDTCG